ncbi:MAG: tetratricopeptide repeat protein [Bacteroidota bacterium]
MKAFIVPFTILLLLFLPSLSFGQNEPMIDSLLEELESTSDQQKIFELSERLWAEYINSDPNLALEQAQRIIQVGNELQLDTIRSNGYYKKGVCYAYMNNFDSSGVYFRKAMTLFEAAKDYEAIASVQRNIGQDFNMTGELDSALYYYQQSRDNFGQIDDSVGIADIHNSVAVVYYMKGYYTIALDEAIAAERIFEQDDALGGDLNQNRMVIATLYGEMRDTLNAVEYYKKTIEYFQANNLKRQYVSNALLLAQLIISDYEKYPEVDDLVENMVSAAYEIDAPNIVHEARHVAAALAYEKGDLAEARSIQLELVEQTAGEEQSLNQVMHNIALGKTLIATREYNRAIGYLKAGEEAAVQFGLEASEAAAKKYLSQAYEGLGDFKNSLLYYQAYKALDGKIYDEERTRRFDELQTIFEIEKKEAALALQAEEIKTLDAEAKANQLSATLYGTGMVSFILISGLLSFGFRQRMKKNQLEREQQEAMFRQELDYKKKELTSQTLHLVQKNTFIQEMQEKLEEIKKEPNLFQKEFHKLVSSLRRQAGEDETWEVFKSYFSQVHNDFDQNLKQVNNEVTENDVRLASFLRMNLTTKEIASLLNVLPDSVLKSKYRLKKKLQLEKEQDLNVYLATL